MRWTTDNSRRLKVEALENRHLLTSVPIVNEPLIELSANDLSEGDRFAESLAFSGNIAVVGAPSDNDHGGDSGSAYVFRRNSSGTPQDVSDDTWTQVQKLHARDAGRGARFGSSVDISGDDATGYTIVVGAAGADGAKRDSGAAYVFAGTGSNFAQQVKLYASDGAKGDDFGDSQSVSIGGNTIVVGAERHNFTGPQSGAVYVYQAGPSGDWSLHSGLQDEKLSASDTDSNDEFGKSVSINGNSLVAGARGAKAAYVFERDTAGWQEQAKLTRSDGGELGWAVTIAETEDTVIASGEWGVFAFVRTATWSSKTEDAEVRADESTEGFRFGWSLSLSDNTLVVGAATASNGGAAYVFDGNGANWTPHTKLIQTDGEGTLGGSVFTDGQIVLVGDAGDDAEQQGVFEDAGSLYVFPRESSSSPNQPPVADAGPAQEGVEDEGVTFDASASSDLDADALTYFWDFGDGQSMQTSSAIVAHAYQYGGIFAVAVTVYDGNGNQSTDTTTATIAERNDAPVAEAGGPYHGIPETGVTFDASGSTDFDNQDGSIDNDQTLTYTWDFGDGSPHATGISVSHTYAMEGDFTVSLTVSDGIDAHIATTTASVAAEPVGSSTHVADLDGAVTSLGGSWRADVTISVQDNLGNPVANAGVEFVWTGGFSGSGSGVTDAIGQVIVSSDKIPKRVADTTLTVTDVTHDALTYAPDDNTDPDGDSSGTAIKVFKDGGTSTPLGAKLLAVTTADDTPTSTQLLSKQVGTNDLSGHHDPAEESSFSSDDRNYATNVTVSPSETWLSQEEPDDFGEGWEWTRVVDEVFAELASL